MFLCLCLSLIGKNINSIMYAIADFVLFNNSLCYESIDNY